MVRTSAGKKARNQWLQYTGRPLVSSRRPRARMVPAPEITILSHKRVRYVRTRKRPRPMLLPGPTSKAAINPTAMADRMAVRARPEGIKRLKTKLMTMRLRRIPR